MGYSTWWKTFSNYLYTNSRKKTEVKINLLLKQDVVIMSSYTVLTFGRVRLNCFPPHQHQHLPSCLLADYFVFRKVDQKKINSKIFRFLILKRCLCLNNNPDTFPRKYTDCSCNQPETVCQHTGFYPPCLWLAGCPVLASKPAGHDWPRLSCKENKQFHWAKSLSLWPSPPPRG